MLISLRLDWFDLLAVQGTLKSLLQHHNSKASVLQHSALVTNILTFPRNNNPGAIFNCALLIWRHSVQVCGKKEG